MMSFCHYGLWLSVEAYLGTIGQMISLRTLLRRMSIFKVSIQRNHFEYLCRLFFSNALKPGEQENMENVVCSQNSGGSALNGTKFESYQSVIVKSILFDLFSKSIFVLLAFLKLIHLS